jgi:hypothetical protein
VAIALDRFKNPIIVFGPMLGHHARGGFLSSRLSARGWAWQQFLRADHSLLQIRHSK